MPRGDGTGPMGMGAMTGRGMGFCAGYSTPGFANRGFGAGLGLARGRGGGRGLGLRRGFAGGFGYSPYAAQAAPMDEAAVLKAQLETMENNIAAIKQRLSELENEGGE